MKEKDNIEILDELIIGRVTPHIYAFTTGTLPNYLKIGDTYRPVQVRLNEWRKHFSDLKQEFEAEAVVDKDIYFRDYAVHRYLEEDLGKLRLTKNLYSGVYFSREFFSNTAPEEIQEAIHNIRMSYARDETRSRYDYYTTNQRLPQTHHYERGPAWTLRPNQQEAVDNFISAINAGRTNLLMYAVMRFGKSFTSLCCAKEMGAKTVLVVSAKADVQEEWKKNVEKPGNFNNFRFVDANDLIANNSVIADIHAAQNTAVIFLTLQDLQGKEIKEKHTQVLREHIDLLIVDETHFGARALSFGEILRTSSAKEKVAFKTDQKLKANLEDDSVLNDEVSEQIKKLNARISLHLSGTPYRILMGSEFEPEDIISFVQFSDIAKEQALWDEKNLNNDEVEEWDNPYFGFPQMIRFAFTPSQKAINKMSELKKLGVSFAFSALFQPRSIKEDKTGETHKQFVHEKEILDLLRVIDGTEEDRNLLGFLDYDKIKSGKMCRHMVMVLPFCASCDAMEKLISKHAGEFKNLGDYEILNISGLGAKKQFKTPNHVKARIEQCEKKNKKTVTLTVNRMLTGSTVEHWDTMIYLKDTASPQEYDQAVFRLQNQYIRELSDGKQVIKENLKPQTLLVDFDPNRLFRMQEQKSLIYNANTDKSGNSKLIERIHEELTISPVVTVNHDKIQQVQATDIINAVAQYNNTRSISDEVIDLPIDLSILSHEELYRLIMSQNPFGSKEGLTTKSHEGEETDLQIDNPMTPQEDGDDGKNSNDDPSLALDLTDKKEIQDLEKRIQTYYQRILFYAFLTRTPINSLDEAIDSLSTEDNARIAANLELRVHDLRLLRTTLNPFKLSAFDYKIHNISKLAIDETLSPLERATTSLSKFSRMSSSEIITPMKICNEMVALLPEEDLRHAVENGEKLLDIASKAGEYAVALVKRLIELGYKTEQFENMIYSIPTSPVAYEFTRRFYEVLGLNINCIASKFNAYDLLNVKNECGEVDHAKLKSILTQAKIFAEISTEDEIGEGEEVVFAAVVGNPPYQDNHVGGNRQAKPIYHHYYELSSNISYSYTLITPARFLSNQGATPKPWNQKMLNSDDIKIANYFPNSKTAFSDAIDVKGGVCILYRNVNASFGPIDTFIPFKSLNSIWGKVKARHKAYLSSWIFSPDSYRFTDTLFEENPTLIGRTDESHAKAVSSNVFGRYPEIFFDAKPDDAQEYIQIYGRKNGVRCYKYCKRSYIKDHQNLDSWKVFLPGANGSGTLGEVLSTPVVGQPVVGHNQTFISIGVLDTEYEAESLLKYIKSKFTRALIGIMKTTQNNQSRNTWSKVPIQDFSPNSDIDWSQNISDIDQQLYKKYRLDNEEINFIETNVTPMD